MAVAAVVALVAGAWSEHKSAQERQRALEDQRKETALKRQRQRQQAIADAVKARAQARASAAAAGVSAGSSAVQQGATGIGAQLTSNLGFLNQMQQLDDSQLQHQGKAATWQSYGRTASAIGSAAGSF